MRVLALVPSFFGPSGDAVNERQLLMTLAGKVKRCYIITFIGFKQIFTKRRAELNIPLPKNMILIPLPFPQINILIVCFVAIIVSCFMSIVSLILNMLKKIDLIYIRNSFLSVGFLTFQSLARKTIVKIPAIIEDEITDGVIIKSLIKKITSFTDRLVLARAGKVAVNGRPLYYKLVRRRSFKHKNEPLEIPPGVNLNLIKSVKDGISGKISPNLSKERYIVGFLGLITWWQGIDVLVKSVAKLKKMNLEKSVKLLLVGDGPERRRIEDLCKKLEIDYEITGFVEHEKALEYLSMFDVLVLPRYRISTTESNIPIKVIEAWALGVPVIVTRHESFLSRNIRDYEDVIYCEPDLNSVTKAIFTILTNDELKRKIRANGLRLAEQFDYNKIAERLLNAFDNQ
jgi:glycosyltransferase involved in cell wall biosynthesis